MGSFLHAPGPLVRPLRIALPVRHLVPLVLAALVGCSEGTAPAPVASTIRLSHATLALGDGDTTRLTAVVLDREGAEMAPLPRGVRLAWTSTAPAVVAVSEGLVTALRPGTATVTAEAGAARQAVEVTVRPVATSVSAAGGEGQRGAPGAPLADSLAVRVVDRHGEGVAGMPVAFRAGEGAGSLSPSAVTTGADGIARAAWVLGPRAGEQTATAEVRGLPGGSVAFRATAEAPQPAEAPALTAVSPALLTPGATAILTGSHFGASAVENGVTVAGVAAAVVESTPSRLTIRVPARDLLPCAPAGPVPVVVTVGGRSASHEHPLEVAAPRALEVGESMTLRSAELRCNRLPPGRGQYLVSVFNTGTSPAESAPFELRGGTGGAATSRLPAAAPRAVLPAPLRSLAGEGGDGHLEVLEANRALLGSLGPRLRAGSGASRTRLAGPPPAVGDTLSFRIPTIGAADLCSSFTEVRARAVYVGRHAVVWEDVAAPLAGQMDPSYQAVGREYDDTMHGVLLANFGNPLAVDGLTDANGRLFMLFSKVVNDGRQSVAGFVFSGDLFRRAECAASDVAEIFYARVPTSVEAGFSSSATREGWLRSMRATIVHEVKHLASYSERLAAGARSWEENWLEESTARVAEEIWARGVFGYAQRENTTYAQSIHCEVRPTHPACVGQPLVMLDHLAGLYDYARSGGALSPLGRARSDDASYYGSGWSLVRWAVDHAPGTESAFLRALTREPSLSGVRNLEARTGRSFADLLADWSLALAADDRPGFAPARAQLTLPSWNLPDLFAGMNRDFPASWESADPVPARRLRASSFRLDVPTLRGGSAVVVELSADGSGAPVLELRGSGGAPPAPALGISIVRVR